MSTLELTVTEAVRFSRYSRCHIYGLIIQAKIKSRKVNTRAAPIILIDKASLEVYMQERGRSINGEVTINR